MSRTPGHRPPPPIGAFRGHLSGDVTPAPVPKVPASRPSVTTGVRFPGVQALTAPASGRNGRANPSAARPTHSNAAAARAYSGASIPASALASAADGVDTSVPAVTALRQAYRQPTIAVSQERPSASPMKSTAAAASAAKPVPSASRPAAVSTLARVAPSGAAKPAAAGVASSSATLQVPRTLNATPSELEIEQLLTGVDIDATPTAADESTPTEPVADESSPPSPPPLIAPSLLQAADTDALESALINCYGGEEIELTGKEYTISAGLQIDHSVTVRGSGPASTVLRFDGGYLLASPSVKAALLENLTIVSTSDQPAIFVKEDADLTLHNVAVSHFRHYFAYVEPAGRLAAERCDFTGFDGIGVFLADEKGRCGHFEQPLDDNMFGAAPVYVTVGGKYCAYAARKQEHVWPASTLDELCNAVASAAEGDVIELAAATTFAPAAPLQINHRMTIRGSGQTSVLQFDAGSAGCILVPDHVKGVVVEHLTLTGSSEQPAVFVKEGASLLLRSVAVVHLKQYFLYVEPDAVAGLERCDLSRFAGVGVYIQERSGRSGRFEQPRDDNDFGPSPCWVTVGDRYCAYAARSRPYTWSVSSLAELEAALATAIDNDVVELVAGDYDLGTRIALTRPVTIRGAGSTTVLRVPEGAWGSIVVVSGVSGAVLESLSLASAHQDQPFLFVKERGGLTLRHVAVAGFKNYFVFVEHEASFVVEGCDFAAFTGVGAFVQETPGQSNGSVTKTGAPSNFGPSGFWMTVGAKYRAGNLHKG